MRDSWPTSGLLISPCSCAASACSSARSSRSHFCSCRRDGTPLVPAGGSVLAGSSHTVLRLVPGGVDDFFRLSCAPALLPLKVSGFCTFRPPAARISSSVSPLVGKESSLSSAFGAGDSSGGSAESPPSSERPSSEGDDRSRGLDRKKNERGGDAMHDGTMHDGGASDCVSGGTKTVAKRSSHRPTARPVPRRAMVGGPSSVLTISSPGPCQLLVLKAFYLGLGPNYKNHTLFCCLTRWVKKKTTRRSSSVDFNTMRLNIPLFFIAGAAAAAAAGPLIQSLKFNRWLKPSSTPLQIAAVASLRGGGGEVSRDDPQTSGCHSPSLNRR